MVKLCSYYKSKDPWTRTIRDKLNKNPFAHGSSFGDIGPWTLSWNRLSDTNNKQPEKNTGPQNAIPEFP
jgi:hypothetical protein